MTNLQVPVRLSRIIELITRIGIRVRHRLRDSDLDSDTDSDTDSNINSNSDSDSESNSDSDTNAHTDVVPSVLKKLETETKEELSCLFGFLPHIEFKDQERELDRNHRDVTSFS